MNTVSDPVVIVGGGQAAVQLCLALRKEKYDGEIMIFSAESEPPYHRPPLSKAYITGQADDSKLAMRPESFYPAKNIQLKLNDEVLSIDASAKTIASASGKQAYSSLVIATGAVARPLQIEGRDAKAVYELRDIHDARSIKAALEKANHVVVIGAGFIGLEVAAAANQSGKKVTVFDMADRVMGRAVAPLISHWFEKTHRAAGIDIHLQESIKGIVSDDSGHVTGVERNSSEILEAQLVLIGIGVLPNSDIASAAGIQCDNGVVVDKYCRTSNPHIYAAGDCANHPNVFADGRRVRLESIQNATDQARVIASAIVAGGEATRAYGAVPWFWSDQAEHALQMTGLSFDADSYAVRGEPASASFSVFHYRQQQLLAVDSVNSSRDHMLSRKMLAAGVSPTPEQVEDTSFNLLDLVKSAN